MTSRRLGRILGATAGAGLGLLLLAPRVGAQDGTSYDGSSITSPSSTSSSPFTITAAFHHDGKVTGRVFLTVPAGLPVACPAPGETELKATSTYASSVTQVSATAGVPCNGHYGIRVDGKGSIIPGDSKTLNGSVDVVVPPANITGVQSAVNGDGSKVALSWDAPSSPAADFIGYRIQRQDGDSWVDLGSQPPDRTTFVDDGVPEGGGSVTYRIQGLRSGPGDPVPSTGGGRVVANLPAPTTTTVSGATDGGDGGDTKGGTTPTTAAGGTGGTAGATTGGTAGATTGGKAGGSTKPQDRGDVGTGVKAPNVGRSGSVDVPALADGEDGGDPGYDEKIDYGTEDGLADGEGGSEDGLSSAFYEPGSGKGMAVPVATGFVLAAWAFHLRFLAKAAKPAGAAPRRANPFTSGR